MAFSYSHPQNHILTCLPAPSRRRLFADLQSVSLPKDYRLVSRGEPVEEVYFLNSGIVSVMLPSPRTKQLAVGMIGYEGLAPWSFISTRDRSQFDMVMHFAGDGFRIELGAFMEAVNEDRVIADVVRRFSLSLQIQIAYSANSNASDTIEVRLARWLLMCRDRVWGNDLEVTHDQLAMNLGLRRPGVTTALHVLEGHGFIRASRGVISIRDRNSLKSFAGQSYGAPEREYYKLIGGSLADERITASGSIHPSAFREGAPRPSS